ncbi:MAG TPA: histidine kinase dimerization/phosphoacceptor domain -containing protein, partial [Spirochaetota bacterium]|nr:histidine kinase dimerization/phosphoacceptor domain -containing protein [Spirochaetota bacterium]
FETSPDAIGISRLNDGVYTDVNGGFTHLLGYTPEEVIGRSSVELELWTTEERKNLLFDDLLINGIVRDREIVIKKKGGRAVDALVSAARFNTGGEDCVIVIATDISRLKETESRLRKSVEEKDVLLCELYHRTKNNMQLMSSFLKLQLRYAGNKTIEEIVTDADRRINAMALVHQMLVKSNNLSRISLSDYVTELVGEIFSSFHGRTSGIEPVFVMEPVKILFDVAVPCGIVINEMVSNALKYAFPDGRSGRLIIGLRRTTGSMIELEVADDGVGLPADFDPKNTTSLGVVIMYNVVEQQLHGTIRYETDGGLRWLITFDDGRFVERV